MAVKIEHVKDLTPRCPTCQRDMDKLLAVSDGVIDQHLVYCCPHCRAVVGVGFNSMVDV